MQIGKTLNNKKFITLHNPSNPSFMKWVSVQYKNRKARLATKHLKKLGILYTDETKKT